MSKEIERLRKMRNAASGLLAALRMSMARAAATEAAHVARIAELDAQIAAHSAPETGVNDDQH